MADNKKRKQPTYNAKARVLDTGGSSWLSNALAYTDNADALLQTYQQSIYVYRGVKLISETASSLPLKVFRVANINGDTEEVLNTDALDILTTDIHTKSVSSFLQAIYTHKLLTGKAYVYRPTSDRNTLTIIPPNKVEEKLNTRTDEITSYIITMGSGRLVAQPEEMIVFKELNPIDFNKGASATAAAKFRILLEQKIVDYHNSLLDNGAVPSKIISPKEATGTVSKDKRDESQRNFDRVFKGVSNQGKSMVSPSPLEVHELSSPMKDLKLQEALDFTAKEIEIAFGLPHGILQSETVNVADGKNSRNTLFENTIKPLVNDVLETLNNELIEEMDNRLFYDVEYPAMEDEKVKSEVLTAYVEKGIMTPDEARVRLGLDELGGGADILNATRVNELRPTAKKMIANRKKLFIELEVQHKEYKAAVKEKLEQKNKEVLDKL